MSERTKGRHILLGVSGSVAAYKAAALASSLSRAGCVVKTILTDGGSRFITEEALAAVTRQKVHRKMFEDPQEIRHISLAEWADLLIVYPASAALLSRCASGAAADLLSSVYLALGQDKPVILAPAMNELMLCHPAVRNNLETLLSYGCRILEPQTGELACGKVGKGRLAEPEDALLMIEEVLR